MAQVVDGYGVAGVRFCKVNGDGYFWHWGLTMASLPGPSNGPSLSGIGIISAQKLSSGKVYQVCANERAQLHDLRFVGHEAIGKSAGTENPEYLARRIKNKLVGRLLGKLGFGVGCGAEQAGFASGVQSGTKRLRFPPDSDGKTKTKPSQAHRVLPLGDIRKCSPVPASAGRGWLLWLRDTNERLVTRKRTTEPHLRVPPLPFR